MFKNSDLNLFFVFIVIVISIGFKIFFNEDGYLSNDSTNYLFLAQNIVNGYGLSVPLESGDVYERSLFSSWPIGYSTLIAFTAKVTSLSVFLSSKILNLFFIALILLIFRKLFSSSASLYALIFLFSSYLEIYSFTWSETGFIFGLVLFSYSLYEFLNRSDKLLVPSITLLFSIIFLFLIRYIGIFAIGILGLLIIYFLLDIKNYKKKILILFTISVTSIFLFCSYLYFNFLETGLLTGRSRGFAPESNLELFLTLITAVLAEITIPVYHPRLTYIAPLLLLQLLVFGIVIYRNKVGLIFRPNNQDLISNKFSITNVFFAVGFAYICCIVIVRWIFYFNEYSFRILGPGTFLLFISLISLIKNKFSEDFFSDFKKAIIFLSILSFILYVPVKSVTRYHYQYIDTLELIDQKYGEIPNGSILVFETNKHLKYVRSDLILKLPEKNESWSIFKKRLNKDDNSMIFIEVPDIKKIKGYDQSIINLLEQFPTGQVVQITD